MLVTCSMHGHLTFDRPTRMRGTPDLGPVFDLLAPKMREVAEKAHAALAAAGIRHALAGGLAVGAHGVPRATKDVDFLVGDEAFVVHASGIVTLNPALPIAIDGIPVDAVAVPKAAPFLERALETAPITTGGMPVVGAAELVCMKLLAGRPRDRRDVGDLVEAGLDVKGVRAYLAANAPALLPDFDAVVAESG